VGTDSLGQFVAWLYQLPNRLKNPGNLFVIVFDAFSNPRYAINSASRAAQRVRRVPFCPAGRNNERWRIRVW
jgi:hypothetical protein